MGNLVNKRAKDAAMSARLSPSPPSHRHKPETFPYHNNMGITHRRPSGEKKEEKQASTPVKKGKYYHE